MPDPWRSSQLRDGVVVAILVASGQILLQALGRAVPGAVRFPSAWVPTATPDTGGYLAAAVDLPEVAAEQVTKLVTIVLLRIDLELGLGGWGVVALHVLLLWLAGFALLRSVGGRWGRRAGVLSAAALVLNPQIAQWTRTLLTDPVFMPLVVLLVLLLATSAGRKMRTASALGLAGALVLVRPNGVGALLGALGILIARLHRARIATAALAVVTLAVVVVVSPVFQSPGGEENTLAARTYEGLVIWAAPNDVRIPMPDPADPDDLSNAAVVRYAFQHPVAVGELGIRRVVAEVTQIRPHYARGVNLVVGLQMALFALLALIGAVRARKDPLTPSILAVTAGLLLVVAGTWAIAEGRFGWAAFAAWSPWVGIGADRTLVRLRRGIAGSARVGGSSEGPAPTL